MLGVLLIQLIGGEDGSSFSCLYILPASARNRTPIPEVTGNALPLQLSPTASSVAGILGDRAPAKCRVSAGAGKGWWNRFLGMSSHAHKAREKTTERARE